MVAVSQDGEDSKIGPTSKERRERRRASLSGSAEEEEEEVTVVRMCLASLTAAKCAMASSCAQK